MKLYFALLSFILLTLQGCSDFAVTSGNLTPDNPDKSDTTPKIPNENEFKLSGSIHFLPSSMKTPITVVQENTRISTSTDFQFNLTKGSQYSLSLENVPSHLTCDISHGSGQLTQDIQNILIQCNSNMQTTSNGYFEPGFCETSVGAPSLTVFPSIYTASIDADGLWQEAEVFYKTKQANTWFKGQNLVINQHQDAHTVLFNLEANQQYDLLIKSNTHQICKNFTTIDFFQPTPSSHHLYVDANAQTSGNGELQSPFKTISEAINNAQDGSKILVAAGSYNESLNINYNGEQMLQIIGEAGAVLTGATNLLGESLLWQKDSAAKTYYAEPSRIGHSLINPEQFTPPYSNDDLNASKTINPHYILKDNQRMYRYLSLNDLKAGLGKNNNAIDEGFYFENNKIWVRSNNHPNQHQWTVSNLDRGIVVNNSQNVSISGFEIKNFLNTKDEWSSTCLKLSDSKNIIVDNNKIHNCGFALLLTDQSTEQFQITNNELFQSNDTSWPWEAVKATYQENTAISIKSTGHGIIANNYIHHIFNGIYAGDWQIVKNGSMEAQMNLARDLDIFNNNLDFISDDGVEPEAGGVTFRFWGNQLSNQHNAVSIAPITVGPAYIINNRIFEFTGGTIKVSIDSVGPTFIYQNSAQTTHVNQNGDGVNALSDSGSFGNIWFKNNSFVSTRYGLEYDNSKLGVVEFDYNNFYTTDNDRMYKWFGSRYLNQRTFCENQNQECNGKNEPVMYNDSNMTLASDSLLIDAGLHFLGINDQYLGQAPDIGASEFGF